MLSATEFQQLHKVKKKYSADDLEKALSDISKGSSVYASAVRYKIPKSTLHKRLHGNTKEKPGGKVIFSSGTEQEITSWIIKCAERGGPVTKQQVMATAHKIRQELTGNKNVDAPTTTWFKGFMKRSQSLSSRIAQPITRSSACVSEDDIRRWFAKIENYLKAENLLHLLTESERWINCDETGYELNPKPGKVLAGKGAKVVNFVETAHPSERVSVMYTFGADGHSYSPQIILKNSVSGNKLHEMAAASVGELINRNHSVFLTFLFFRLWWTFLILSNRQRISDPNIV